jgi:hypothetical protein
MKMNVDPPMVRKKQRIQKIQKILKKYIIILLNFCLLIN